MNELVFKRGILLANIAFFLALLKFLPYPHETTIGLSILIFIAILWLTEAIHISITALLVPVLAIGLGVFKTTAALSHFANPIIFLFLGGFALASALNRQELDSAIANIVLNAAKGRLVTAVLLLFAVTAALSMWISNTATAAMMLPLAFGMLSQVDRQKKASTWTFVLLGIAYCASLGGIATLVGSPPNAIAAAETGMTFVEWMKKGLPISLVLLPTAIFVLYLVIKPDLSARIPINKTSIVWNKEKKITIAIFLATVMCWVFSVPLNNFLGNFDNFDTLIAMGAMLSLAIFGVVGWRDIDRTTDWGVLILFGGGLCLSAVLKETNTSLFLAESLGALIGSAGSLVAILAIITFVIILTEFASNTASAALLIPVFVGIADSLGLDPIVIATVIAIAASCAFMLPVATPPNAIVFGSGYVPQRTMMRAGLWLNLACIGVLTLYVQLFW